jgi:hypothetical protein
LLHLKGDTNANGAELYLQVNNNNTTDNLGAINFGNNVDLTLSKILSGTSGASNSSYLTFSTSSSGSQSEAMRIDSSGNLLVGTTTAGTMSGDAVIAFGSRGGIIEKTATVAASGTVDIAVNTSGGGYQGFMIVSNTVSNSATVRTHRTYSVFGRGTDSSIQQIAADNGTSAAAFTVTTPTNGVIRVTNTSAYTCIVAIQFFGGTSV